MFSTNTLRVALVLMVVVSALTVDAKKAGQRKNKKDKSAKPEKSEKSAKSGKSGKGKGSGKGSGKGCNFYKKYYAENEKKLALERATCPSGFEKLDNNCYAFQKGPSTFAEAKAACKALGAYVAEPVSVEQNTFIKNMMKANNAAATWLSANDIKKEGEFVWDKSGKVVSEGYSDWSNNEPNDHGSGEDCTTIRSHSNNWNDMSCAYKTTFVCETTLG